MEAFIEGSAQNFRAQRPAFFLRQENSFEMHFMTKKVNYKNEYETGWHYMHFKEDFMDILSDFGHLPSTSMRHFLQIESELKL